MDITSLGKMVKEKYPEYADMSDEEVGTRVSNKYGGKVPGPPAAPGTLAKIWNFINTPLAPEVPHTYYTPNADDSPLTAGVKAGLQEASWQTYDKLVKPMTAPAVLALGGLARMGGVAGPALAAAGAAGFTGMMGKDTIAAAPEAWDKLVKLNGTPQEIGEAAAKFLSTAGFALLGTGDMMRNTVAGQLPLSELPGHLKDAVKGIGQDLPSTVGSMQNTPIKVLHEMLTPKVLEDMSKRWYTFNVLQNLPKVQYQPKGASEPAALGETPYTKIPATDWEGILQHPSLQQGDIFWNGLDRLVAGAAATGEGLSLWDVQKHILTSGLKVKSTAYPPPYSSPRENAGPPSIPEALQDLGFTEAHTAAKNNYYRFRSDASDMEWELRDDFEYTVPAAAGVNHYNHQDRIRSNIKRLIDPMADPDERVASYDWLTNKLNRVTGERRKDAADLLMRLARYKALGDGMIDKHREFSAYEEQAMTRAQEMAQERQEQVAGLQAEWDRRYPEGYTNPRDQYPDYPVPAGKDRELLSFSANPSEMVHPDTTELMANLNRRKQALLDQIPPLEERIRTLTDEINSPDIDWTQQDRLYGERGTIRQQRDTLRNQVYEIENEVDRGGPPSPFKSKGAHTLQPNEVGYMRLGTREGLIKTLGDKFRLMLEWQNDIAQDARKLGQLPHSGGPLTMQADTAKLKQTTETILDERVKLKNLYDELTQLQWNPRARGLAAIPPEKLPGILAGKEKALSKLREGDPNRAKLEGEIANLKSLISGGSEIKTSEVEDPEVTGKRAAVEAARKNLRNLKDKEDQLRTRLQGQGYYHNVGPYKVPRLPFADATEKWTDANLKAFFHNHISRYPNLDVFGIVDGPSSAMLQQYGKKVTGVALEPTGDGNYKFEGAGGGIDFPKEDAAIELPLLCGKAAADMLLARMAQREGRVTVTASELPHDPADTSPSIITPNDNNPETIRKFKGLSFAYDNMYPTTIRDFLRKFGEVEYAKELWKDDDGQIWGAHTYRIPQALKDHVMTKKSEILPALLPFLIKIGLGGATVAGYQMLPDDEKKKYAKFGGYALMGGMLGGSRNSVFRPEGGFLKSRVIDTLKGVETPITTKEGKGGQITPATKQLMNKIEAEGGKISESEARLTGLNDFVKAAPTEVTPDMARQIVAHSRDIVEVKIRSFGFDPIRYSGQTTDLLNNQYMGIARRTFAQQNDPNLPGYGQPKDFDIRLLKIPGLGYAGQGMELRHFNQATSKGYFLHQRSALLDLVSGGQEPALIELQSDILNKRRAIQASVPQGQPNPLDIANYLAPGKIMDIGNMWAIHTAIEKGGNMLLIPASEKTVWRLQGWDSLHTSGGSIRTMVQMPDGSTVPAIEVLEHNNPNPVGYKSVETGEPLAGAVPAQGARRDLWHEHSVTFEKHPRGTPLWTKDAYGSWKKQPAINDMTDVGLGIAAHDISTVVRQYVEEAPKWYRKNGFELQEVPVKYADGGRDVWLGINLRGAAGQKFSGRQSLPAIMGPIMAGTWLGKQFFQANSDDNELNKYKIPRIGSVQ